MNALTSQLLHNQHNSALVYSLFGESGIEVIESPELTRYEEEAYTALIAHGTGLVISRIVPKYKLGRVFSFDVTPREYSDPTLAFCASLDLSEYHRFWSKAMGYRETFPWKWRRTKILNEYRGMVERTIRNSERLTDPERLFLLIEIMKLENELLL